jgi:hypothetical protein
MLTDRLSAPLTSPKSADVLLASLSQLMTGYALSPNANTAAEIVRCLEMLATSAEDASPLLREAGQQLSEVWRKKAFAPSAPAKPKQTAPENSATCQLRALAEGEHCALAYCADCGTVHARFSSFNVRLPAAVFRSTCQTFLEAEERLKRCSSQSIDVSRRAVGGKRSRH